MKPILSTIGNPHLASNHSCYGTTLHYSNAFLVWQKLEYTGSNCLRVSLFQLMQNVYDSDKIYVLGIRDHLSPRLKNHSSHPIFS